MQDKYLKGVIAGVALGVPSGVYEIISFFVRLASRDQSNGLLTVASIFFNGCCMIPVNIMLSAMAGAMAVWMASSLLTTRHQAIRVAVVAGSTFALVTLVILLIISFIQPFFIPSTINDKYPELAVFGSGALGGLANFLSMLICCCPFTLVICVLAAAAGGEVPGIVKQRPR